VPPGRRHTFWNPNEAPATYLTVISPAGFERYCPNWPPAFNESPPKTTLPRSGSDSAPRTTSPLKARLLTGGETGRQRFRIRLMGPAGDGIPDSPSKPQLRSVVLGPAQRYHSAILDASSSAA